MPCTLSTKKRARLAQASASMPIWTSLPYDLVHSMGDGLLSDNNIDAYMAFRAVCHEWRSITKDDDPSKAKAKAGDNTDPIARFKHFWITYANKPACMTSFGGNVYAIDRYGSIYKSTITVGTGESMSRCAMDISTEAISPSLDTGAQGTMIRGRYYLVESTGDLLLVTKPSGFTIDQPVVRRVNTETQMFEPVSSIGNRALFVSHGKCLSIDADKFPSILGGCVYFLEAIVTRGCYAYAVADRSIVHVADNVVKFDWFPEGFIRPFTLAKVLTDYCRSVHYSELCEMMASKWDRDLSDGDDSESDESSSSELDDEESSSSEPDDEEASSSEPADD